jgi:plastocyanin
VPSQLTIRAGEGVTWVNVDARIHTLESDLFSRAIPPRQNFSWTFHEPGRFFFWDGDLGRTMNGTVVIS